LNGQVNARCIGMRYCANACPYAVRHFNFARASWDAPLEQALNPDVALREVGVIEKCTFCYQRIRRARERAAIERRPIRDDEVQPACAEACPPRAIVMGDLDDPASKAATLARSGRAVRLLEELGTEPKVFYLQQGD
jgi:molybdopterin-containing oxidoreductase family iron-sulfur binding subunit